MLTELKQKSSFHDIKTSFLVYGNIQNVFFHFFFRLLFCLCVQKTVSSTQFPNVGSVIFPDAKKAAPSKRNAGNYIEIVKEQKLFREHSYFIYDDFLIVSFHFLEAPLIISGFFFRPPLKGCWFIKGKYHTPPPPAVQHVKHTLSHIKVLWQVYWAVLVIKIVNQ